MKLKFHRQLKVSFSGKFYYLSEFSTNRSYIFLMYLRSILGAYLLHNAYQKVQRLLSGVLWY